MVVESGLLRAAAPVAGGFVTGPRPVQKIEIHSLRVVGRADRPGILPTGAVSVPVPAIRMAPFPDESILNHCCPGKIPLKFNKRCSMSRLGGSLLGNDLKCEAQKMAL